MQQARIYKGIGKVGRGLGRRPTSSARQLSVGLQAGRSGTSMTNSELCGNRIATTEMHLVRRLAGEGGKRNDGVVLQRK
jgi:hypothetical protein